jgi:mannose-6-phosphate isomerase-like protein (cupin superfamily)
VAKPGDRMTSAESGETFIFLKTAAETDGKLLVFDMLCEPGGGAKGAPIHYHPKQEERFYIHQGMCEITLNGYTFLAYPGDKIIIPAGAPHTWRNPNPDDRLQFRVEVEPAGGIEYIFEHMTALSQLGKLYPDGRVPLLAMARVLQRYPDNLYIAHIPAWIQKIGIALLSIVARLGGYPVMYSYEEATQRRGEQGNLAQAIGVD